MSLAGSTGRLGAVLVLAALCALAPQSAGAASFPNHHEIEALYVIDHNGTRPHSDRDLIVYSQPFQKILRGCYIGVYGLTMNAINLADQASTVGARHVSSLMILQSIAVRVTWADRRGCQYVYNLAEARRENGDV